MNADELREHRADQFRHRIAMFADACELVEIATRKQANDGVLSEADHGKQHEIVARLTDHRVVFLVVFLSTVCADLAAALTDHTEITLDAVLALIHESAADLIDGYELQLRESGYLP